MIDYLERLFVPDKREWEREREVTAPFLPGEEQTQSLTVSAQGGEDIPRRMAVAELQSEDVKALAAAALQWEEPQKMTQAALRGEDNPGRAVLTAPEQEEIQPLPTAAVWETEGDTVQKRQQIRTYPDERSAPRMRLSGETGRELPRVSAAWEEPSSEAYRTRVPEQYSAGEREEDLEHRLRRNSRRYDSGFFLY